MKRYKMGGAVRPPLSNIHVKGNITTDIGHNNKGKISIIYHSDDKWRAWQVIQVGISCFNHLMGHEVVPVLQREDDMFITEWMGSHFNGRSAVIVLIGAQTADQRWIREEIEKAWREGKGVLGIYIHQLRDENGKIGEKGQNPFERIILEGGNPLSDIVDTHESPYKVSYYVFEDIAGNLTLWIQQSMEGRKK